MYSLVAVFLVITFAGCYNFVPRSQPGVFVAVVVVFVWRAWRGKLKARLKIHIYSLWKTEILGWSCHNRNEYYIGTF